MLRNGPSPAFPTPAHGFDLQSQPQEANHVLTAWEHQGEGPFWLSLEHEEILG